MKKLVPFFLLLLLVPAVLAHEAFTNLIGTIKVELAPNAISPIIHENFTASVTFTDFASSKELYYNYNVKIYNETAQIIEINNLTTSPTTVSSFSYVFQKEGNYFILIEIPSRGQADFPIFVRTPNITGMIVVFVAGLAALIGYFVGRINLLKPLEEEIEVLEVKKKRKRHR